MKRPARLDPRGGSREKKGNEKKRGTKKKTV